MRWLAITICLYGASSFDPAMAQDANGQGDPKAITVTANFQARVPVDAAATTADLTKAIEQAERSLGDIANRECDILAAAFKADCALAQLNMGANVGERRRQNFNNDFGGASRMVGVNLNATFALTPASDAKAAPAAK